MTKIPCNDNNHSSTTPINDSSALDPSEYKKGINITSPFVEKKGNSPKKVPSTSNLPDNLTTAAITAGEVKILDKAPAVFKRNSRHEKVLRLDDMYHLLLRNDDHDGLLLH